MARLSDAALELARLGWPVFPVSAAEKRPRTEHGHLDATTDPSVIAGWRNLFDRGGGIATPTGNGLLVIDIDPRNGGARPSWAPDTLTVSTQSGGTHLYYKIDNDIKSRASIFAPGVDSKCAGGYVLVPPSPGYTWSDVRPRAVLSASEVRARFSEIYAGGSGTERLGPEMWRPGIIHDQVMAWSAYFAGQLSPDDVPTAVWALVDQARAAGCPIDNARDHIGSAIRWAVSRELNSQANTGPSLS